MLYEKFLVLLIIEYFIMAKFLKHLNLHICKYLCFYAEGSN